MTEDAWKFADSDEQVLAELEMWEPTTDPTVPQPMSLLRKPIERRPAIVREHYQGRHRRPRQ